MCHVLAGAPPVADGRAGSPAWVTVSNQPNIQSRARGGNKPREAGRREVSGSNASEGIEPRNHYLASAVDFFAERGKQHSRIRKARVGNPTGSESVA